MNSQERIAWAKGKAAETAADRGDGFRGGEPSCARSQHGHHDPMVVLALSAYVDDMVLPEPDALWITTAALTGRDLTECDVHPHVEEYARHCRWKVAHSHWPKRKGAPDVR